MQIGKRHTEGDLHVRTNKRSDPCFHLYCSCIHLHIWHVYVYEVRSVVITSQEHILN